MTPRAAGDSTGSWWQMECPYPPPHTAVAGSQRCGQPWCSHFGERAGSQVVTVTPSASGCSVALGYRRVQRYVVSSSDPAAKWVVSRLSPGRRVRWGGWVLPGEFLRFHQPTLGPAADLSRTASIHPHAPKYR